MSVNELEQYVADDGEYIIPVTWKSYGTVQITGVKNLKEAYDVAKRYIDELPIPTDGEYIDGSFRISIEENEDVTATLLDAQNYSKHDAYFKNPKASE